MSISNHVCGHKFRITRYRVITLPIHVTQGYIREAGPCLPVAPVNLTASDKNCVHLNLHQQIIIHVKSHCAPFSELYIYVCFTSNQTTLVTNVSLITAS